MSSLNKVMLIGNLGDDPEIRYRQDGTAVATFRVATNEFWKNDKGEKQKRTDWHRVVAFGRLAEICRDYLKKGSLLYVEGKQRTRSWEDQDGNKRWVTENHAQVIRMLDSKNGGDEINPDEDTP